MPLSEKINEKHKDFFEMVWQVVRLIPTGRVTSYGAIAKYLSAPKSSRVVGWAMNAAHQFNDIPAHRVVNRNGLLSGKMHFATPSMMEELLEKEKIEIVADKVVNFKTLFWDPTKELEI